MVKKEIILALMSIILSSFVLAAPCSDGEISSSCECGDQTYMGGHCCDVSNGDNGVWFKDGFYDSCPSGVYHYVSNSGSDSNDGSTPVLAWQTVHQATATALAGDAVIILGGEYDELDGELCNPYDDSYRADCGTLRPDNSGTSGNQIVFKGHPDYARPIFKGADYTRYGINLYRRNYITLDYLEVTETYRGITITAEAEGSESIIVQDCYVHDTGGLSIDNNNGGIMAGFSFSNNLIIRNNTFHHNYMNRPQNNGGVNAHGVLLYRTTDSLIEHNEVWGQMDGGYGIRLKAWNGPNNIVRYNVVHDVHVGISHGTSSQSHQTYGNMVYDVDVGIDARPSGETPTIDDMQIFNNIIYNAALAGILIDQNGFTQVTDFYSKNNIAVNVAGLNDRDDGGDNFGVLVNNHENLDSDYNLYFDDFENDVVLFESTMYTLEEFQNAYPNLEQSSVQADPLFISTSSSSSDFLRPGPTSPAIDAGVVIPGYHCTQAGVETSPGCKMWYGSAPDIGAYEHEVDDSENILFQSSWNTATGSSLNAINDGGAWHYAPRGPPVQDPVVSSGGPGGNNFLNMVSPGGGGPANGHATEWHIDQDKPFGDPDDLYIRVYFRMHQDWVDARSDSLPMSHWFTGVEDATPSGNDGRLTKHYLSFEGETTDLPNVQDWSIRIENYGDGKYGANMNIETERWYCYEIHVESVTPTMERWYVRLDGEDITDQYRCVADDDNPNGPQWGEYLDETYADGRGFTNEEHNNFWHTVYDQITANSGWDVAAIEVRDDRWPGCFGSLQTNTCTDIGGTICNSDETCSAGSFTPADNTNYCCEGSCIPAATQPGITVDSSYSGNNPDVIDDEVIDAYGEEATTWASDESTEPHWVVIDFVDAREIGEVTVWWANNPYQDALMTSQHVDVEYWDGSNYQTAATISHGQEYLESSTVTFTPVSTSRLRLWQPANMGSFDYDSIIWLTEVDYSEGGTCTLVYDTADCNDIDNFELLSALTAWKLGNIDMPSLFEYITLWKTGA